MMYLDKARIYLGVTRRLMKGTLKSGNKLYNYHFWNSAPDKGKGRLEKRNTNAPNAEARLAVIRNILRGEDLTFLGWGGRLYQMLDLKGPEEHARFAGNCGEQAAVALYLAYQRGGILPQHLWMWTWQKEHSGNIRDTTLSHMSAYFGTLRTNKASGNRIPVDQLDGSFCDPWMNIACDSAQYIKDSNAKLSQWKEKRKELWFGEYNYQNDPISYNPTDYRDFAKSRIYEVYNAMDSVPVG